MDGQETVPEMNKPRCSRKAMVGSGSLLALACFALFSHHDSSTSTGIEAFVFGLGGGSSKPVVTVKEAISNTASPQLTSEELEEGLVKDGVIKFANPFTTSWSCIDGRGSEPVFGTPGGDAGEFITAMYAVVNGAGINVIDTVFTVKDAFNKYLEQEIIPSRPFYLHTDSKSVDAAQNALKDSKLNMLLFPENAEQMNKLLETVVANTMMQGCGHLKLMMQNPEKYDVPTEATMSMIQAFFKYAWENNDGKAQTHIHTHGEDTLEHHHDHDDHVHSHSDEGFDSKVDQTSVQAGKVKLVALPGAHAEESVLSIVSDLQGQCAPMVWPSMPTEGGKRRQYFVNHSSGPVIEPFRRKNLRFFMKYFNVKSKTENELLEVYNAMSGKQIGATASVLAGKLPHHHTEIKGNGKC